MSASHITEVFRELEAQVKEKQILLNYLKKDIENKKEVDIFISNNRMNLKCQENPSGNIWSNSENLRENLQKLNIEINLYENVNKSKRR